MRLGFDEVRETAEGAALVTEEYQKLLEKWTDDEHHLYLLSKY